MTKLSARGLGALKQYEGLRLEAYQDVAGVWTIGYGHTSAAGLPHVNRGMTITMREAESILIRDLAQYEATVQRAVNVPMTQGQYDACVSLCYNIGPRAFDRSTLVKRLNRGDVPGAAVALTWWNKAGGRVVGGLVKRRAREKAMFLAPDRKELAAASVLAAGPATVKAGADGMPWAWVLLGAAMGVGIMVWANRHRIAMLFRAKEEPRDE